MLRLRRASERGHADYGWLKARYTFSFASYHDPEHMGFRALRVMNEDRIGPGRGFGTHGHQDMEIVTYVLEGAREHKDSMGNGEVLRPGEFQRMSAGTGILHSEFNPSATEPVHLYQIWLLPQREGADPGYEQKAFDPDEQRGRLRIVASPDGADGSLTIGQDATIALATLALGESVAHEFATGRHGWLQVLRGRVEANGQAAEAGDGLAVSGEPRLTVSAAGADHAEIMLFDLP